MTRKQKILQKQQQNPVIFRKILETQSLSKALEDLRCRRLDFDKEL